jgi:hypothetical protein
MAKSEREWAQRKLKQVIGNLDTSGMYLYEIKEVYEKAHPEISEMMTSIMNILASTIELVTNAKDTF